MTARGQRLACSLRSADGCVGSFSAYPGEAPKSVARVDPIRWDKAPQKEVLEGHFTVIGDMGMTGHIIRLNEAQWRALSLAKLEEAFFGAILWGGDPLKVVQDATLLTRRSG